MLISDRDPKFNSEFWGAVFKSCGATLGMTTAYHPSADGQAERTNQTVEIALRCLLIGQYEEKWEEILFQIEYFFNCFQNVSIGQSPFGTLYGIKPRDLLFSIIRKDSQEAVDFLEERRMIQPFFHLFQFFCDLGGGSHRF